MRTEAKLQCAVLEDSIHVHFAPQFAQEAPLCRFARSGKAGPHNMCSQEGA